tara:strand:+ start:5926 stop:7794 length:1869 start_codon:yes stop_codon:yes gene_type:complete
MGADRTLVDAAFKEATTKYSGDVINMKPMYDSNLASMNKAFSTINSAMDIYSGKKELNRAGVRKQMASFQAQADSLIKGMYAQDEPLPDAFVDAFRGKIESLQEEFELHNTYGKGDTSENSQARNRIMGELKRVTNQAMNFRAGTEIALDNLKNVDPGSFKDERGISAHMQAFNFENYEQLVADGKIKVIYGKNGIEIISKGYDTRTISVPLTNPSEQFLDAGSDNMMDAEESYGEEVTITLASFNEMFKPVDLKSHAALLEDLNNATKNAVAAGGKQNAENDYNVEEYNALFTSHVDTEEKFRNFAKSKIKGVYEIKESFKVSLENKLNIPITVLQNMVIDIDGDGKIDDMDVILKELNLAEDEYINTDDLAKGQGNAAFEKNIDALIDALTETTHPAFDIGVSAPMLGKYLGTINENRYNTAFDKAKKANSKSTDVDQRNIVLGTYRSWESQDGILDLASSGGVINSWDGNEWSPDPSKPGNYINTYGDKKESYPLGNLLRSPYFGMTERINQRKLDYGSGLPAHTDEIIPPASSVETPNVEDFGRNANVDNVLTGWENRYKGMGFTYSKNKPGINQKYTSVTITAENGATHVTELGRTLGKGKEAQAKAFNKFIEDNKI